MIPYNPAKISMTNTKTEMLMLEIRGRIASRALGPGDRMPSIRGFAKTMGVSPSTVVEAYDRLAAEGMIRARRGAGFYVAASHLPPMQVAQMGTPRAQEIDPFWVSRQALSAAPGSLQPGCGWLPPDWMPQEALRKGLRALAKADAGLLTDYPAPGDQGRCLAHCATVSARKTCRLRPIRLC